nr:sporulation protein YjcZ [Paenibacillus chinjuensis]
MGAVGACGGYGTGGGAAFVLVLFILLVIILSAGFMV